MTGKKKLAVCIALGPLVGVMIGLFFGSMNAISMGAAYGLLGGVMLGAALMSLTRKPTTTDGGDDQPRAED